MFRTVNTLLDSTTTVALASNSSVAQLDRITHVDITAVVAGANASNIAFTATAATDICTTATAHGLTTGAKVTLTTTGTLPAGLATATTYYIIVISATTFKLSTSQANALAGTAIDITDAGTGTHTVNVTTTLAGTIKLQKSNDPPETPAASVTWVDVVNAEVLTGTASQTISAAATFNWNLWQFSARALRVVTTITSGTVTVSTRLHGKGP